MADAPPLPQPQPVLTTGRLVLRPFAAADAPEGRRLAGDRRVADTTVNIPHPYEAGMAETWIAGRDEAWACSGRACGASI
jgi:hypothetical protein